MGLFSRRSKRSDHEFRPLEPDAVATTPPAATDAAPDAVERDLEPDAAAPGATTPRTAREVVDDARGVVDDARGVASPPAATEALPDVVVSEVARDSAPHVRISVTSFGGGQLPATRRAARPAAAAPPASESVPGMPDNVLLQAALAALPAQPQSADVMNVMRQALQGQLYVRAQGDAQAQLAQGKGLSLAITTHQDKRFLLVFSGATAMQASATAEGAGATSAVSQSASNVLRMAVDSGYNGVYLDHANEGARLALPIELVRKSLDEGAAPFELKTLLAGARTDATAAQVAAALARAPRVWVAGGTDAEGRMGLAQARGADGSRRLEVYSHPLELLALARGDRALPLTPEQLARALASDTTFTGLMLDPAGPWIELDRADLAPLFALAG